MLVSVGEIMSKRTMPSGGGNLELTATLTATRNSTTILIAG